MNKITKEDLELWKRVIQNVTPLGNSEHSTNNIVIDYEKTFNYQKRIKKKYQDIIDLHGMTQDQAYSVLLTKIPQYISMGYKCVLVITGKGNDNKSGVLNRVFIGWMNNKNFIDYVKNVQISDRGDGGSGAFYVKLNT